MRKKLDLFDSGNKALAAQIMETRKPMTMQSLGHQVRGFQEEIWSKNRMSVMIAGLRLKYAQNTDIRQSLLATASQPLFEASSKDRVWGIGFSSEQVKNTLPAIPRAEYGLNILGLALQTVRAELLAECLLHSVNDGERVAPNVSMVSQELSDDISELSSVSNIQQGEVEKSRGKGFGSGNVSNFVTKYDKDAFVVLESLEPDHWLRRRPAGEGKAKLVPQLESEVVTQWVHNGKVVDSRTGQQMLDITRGIDSQSLTPTEVIPTNTEPSAQAPLLTPEQLLQSHISKLSKDDLRAKRKVQHKSR